VIGSPADGATALPGERPGALDGVLLDVGGDVGALVLLADPALIGSEIEVAPVGIDGHRVHTVVHSRLVGSTTVAAAVFVELVAGRYAICDSRELGDITVEGGRVSQVDLRSS
jgi:hypothetical protein